MNVLDHHISVSFDMAAWGRAYESVDPLLILDAKKSQIGYVYSAYWPI